MWIIAKDYEYCFNLIKRWKSDGGGWGTGVLQGSEEVKLLPQVRTPCEVQHIKLSVHGNVWIHPNPSQPNPQLFRAFLALHCRCRYVLCLLFHWPWPLPRQNP